MNEEVNRVAQKRRFKFDKLIRHRVREMMEQKNIRVHSRLIQGTEYHEKLHEKLIEETHEVVKAKTEEEKLEELADVLEVLHAFSLSLGSSLDEIDRIRQAKKLKKGGFEEGVYCTHIELECDHPDVAYYDERPDQYTALPSTERVRL